MNRRTGTIAAVSVLTLLALCPLSVRAEYPHKNVKLVTHSSPGGGTDLFLRQAVNYLGPIMGVTFVVENVRGGSGAKAMAAVAPAPADGSIFYGSTPTYISTSILSKPEFTYKDLEPVVNVFLDPMVAYTAVESPFKTLTEAVDFARKNPGKGKWGTGTPTSLEQQVVQELKRAAGVSDVAIVSFEGGGDLMLNVLGGRLDMGIGEPGEILSQLEAGKLRLLGSFTEQRMANFPDVKTAKEQGYDVVLTKYRGIVGPKGLPADVVKAWEAAIPKLLADSGYKEIYTKENLIPTFMNQKDFKAYVEKRAAGIEAYYRQIGVVE